MPHGSQRHRRWKMRRGGCTSLRVATTAHSRAVTSTCSFARASTAVRTGAHASTVALAATSALATKLSLSFSTMETPPWCGAQPPLGHEQRRAWPHWGLATGDVSDMVEMRHRWERRGGWSATARPGGYDRVRRKRGLQDCDHTMIERLSIVIV